MFWRMVARRIIVLGCHGSVEPFFAGKRRILLLRLEWIITCVNFVHRVPPHRSIVVFELDRYVLMMMTDMN